MNLTTEQITAAVVALSQKYPGLTIDGLNRVPRDNGKQDAFEAVLKDALHRPDHIIKSIHWLRKCSRRKTFNLMNDTYGYKHEAEACEGYWISHTSMLVAVQLEGLEMKPNPNRPWAGVLKLGEIRP